MDNNQDKNVYQVPASPLSSTKGESLDAPLTPVDVELSEAQVEQRFSAIAREEVLQAFNQMTQDLEMSISGYETREQPKIELVSPHPIAVELLQIGDGVEEGRLQHHSSLIEAAQRKRFLGRMITRLFAKNPSVALNPSIENIVDHESISVDVFPNDPEVTELKFFFLPDTDGHKWYHKQTSQIPSKHFTNSYIVTESGIEKSSTFYDEAHGRVVNVSVSVDDMEAQNLLAAAKKYYSEVTGKVYVKKPASRLRFRSKDDDLAA